MSYPPRRRGSPQWQHQTPGAPVILALLAATVLVLLLVLFFWRSLWWIDDEATHVPSPRHDTLVHTDAAAPVDRLAAGHRDAGRS